MDAKTLIQAVKTEKSNGWKNSSLDAAIQNLLEKIVSHYETCEECRDAFDDTEYDEETLEDMKELFTQSLDIDLWLCDEIA